MYMKHEIPSARRGAALAMAPAPGLFKNMLLAMWLVMAWLCCAVASAATSISAVATPSSAVAPANVTLSIAVTPDPGPVTVTRVEYFNGTASLGVASIAPFSLPLTSLAAGSYAIVAKATIDDPANPVLTSTPTPLTIAAAPSGSTEVYYIHADHLNTPRAIVNSSNALVWKWESDGFGSLPPNETPGGAARFVFNQRFPGQYYDGESNLHYNYFRDYDPQTGRYVQSDPIGLDGGINTYAYVSANPLSLTDPTGLDPWYREPAVRRREAIAREARAMSGSDKWSQSKSHPNTKGISSRPFGFGQFKCNLYVDDILRKAGQSPGMAGNGLPRVASDWYSGNTPGYTEIPANLASNGDIVAKVYPGQSGYTGHVGIVVGPNRTASQSSITDNIIINDYGFRPEDEGQSKFFRCECSQ